VARNSSGIVATKTRDPGNDIGLLAQHDMLFLGEKGQAKSRLMRLLMRFSTGDPVPGYSRLPVHEDPFKRSRPSPSDS